jgi:acyl carrier protein
MTQDDIEKRLQAVFRRIFDNDAIELRHEMTAVDIPGWDSIVHIQLIVAAEKEFRVSFTTNEALALRNVGDFIALLHSKTK